MERPLGQTVATLRDTLSMQTIEEQMSQFTGRHPTVALIDMSEVGYCVVFAEGKEQPHSMYVRPMQRMVPGASVPYHGVTTQTRRTFFVGNWDEGRELPTVISRGLSETEISKLLIFCDAMSDVQFLSEVPR